MASQPTLWQFMKEQFLIVISKATDSPVDSINGENIRGSNPKPLTERTICYRTHRRQVMRNFAPLWQERKWQRQANRFTGFYRTRYGAYQGIIVERFLGSFEFYIKNPPSCLRRHSHAACFWPKGKGLIYVHFSQPARTPDEGIIAIEQILLEAHLLEACTKRYQR